MIKEVIAPNNLHRPFGYAHAIQIGNTIYISGQILLNQDMKIVGKNNIAAQVERAFKTLKTTLELRPLYHHKEERIRAHVLLCFLSLLLVRIAERQTGQTWDHLRAILERIHLGEFESKDGCILQRTELTHDQANLLKTLSISAPPKIQKVHLKA